MYQFFEKVDDMYVIFFHTAILVVGWRRYKTVIIVG